MWKWTFGIVVSICFSVPLYAQCPGGGSCPSPRPPSINIGDLPNVDGQRGQYGPVEATGHLVSVVRIIGVEAPGHYVKGSGTYVNYEGVYCVVTASHVVRGVNQLYVRFPFSTPPVTIQGKVLVNDQTNDCVIIGLFKHPENAEDIAGKVAYKDDIDNLESLKLQNAGFGGDDVLNAGYGQITDYMAPNSGLPKNWMVINSTARLGDSGGPIFLPSGKLVGLLWGKDDRSIVCVRLNVIHARLQEAKTQVSVEQTQVVQPRPLPRQPKKLVPVFPLNPPVLPWRDKIEREIDGIKKQPKPDCNPVKPNPPNVDVEVKPAPQQPDAQPVQDERYRVDVALAISIICAAALACAAIGFLYQWKKTYSVK